MDAQAIVAVSVTVVGLAQLIKSMGFPKERAPLAVFGLSLLGVAVWAWSRGNFSQTTAFDYLAGWIVVATSAAGVFNIVKSAPAALTATKKPEADAISE